MSLRRKLLLLVVLPVIVCTSIAVFLLSVKIYNQGLNDLKDKSNVILALNILEFVYHHVDGNSITEMNKQEALNGITSKLDNEVQNITNHAHDQTQIAGDNHEITQANTASSEEMSHSAASLHNQTNNLLQAISYFKTKSDEITNLNE